ncbi:MAG: outer membrane protein assembly factor BamB [Limisphaerales bacterium]|jgi:outer membrane protein assembly factor BamB
MFASISSACWNRNRHPPVNLPRQTFTLLATLLCLPAARSLAQSAPALTVLVMDPLALQLSCACVDGTGQRRYSQLADHLEKSLGRSIRLIFDESLALALNRAPNGIDLVIGKDAMVRFDATATGTHLRPVAALTDRRKRTVFSGVFVVHKDSGLSALKQLAGSHIALGPIEDEETNGAARATLAQAGVSRVRFTVCGSIDSAALMVHDGEADAAVVSDFLPPLLEGCGKLEKGTIEVIGSTGEIPFIRIFAADSISSEFEEKLFLALKNAGKKPRLLAALESGSGFQSVRRPETHAVFEWHDWRGPNRRGMAPQIPSRLPAKPKRLWTHQSTGPAVSGVAADRNIVIVADKTADNETDVFACIDADTGKTRWALRYAAPGDMEYSNAPRATPVIHEGLVYLQGAMGHLHCVDLKSGKIIWKKNIFTDFGSERLNWGASVPPLVVAGKLIINPGAESASVVALDRKTGTVIWKTPGHAAAYSAFVVEQFAGVRQIVGYDSAGLGGWDPSNGKRLWELVPPAGSDFNVLTPVILGQQILLGSENNGTRLYGFDKSGRIINSPVARNDDLAPDTCTPVVVDGKIYATAYGELFCVRLQDMKTLWKVADDMFYDHSTVIGGSDRVLVWTMSGDLLLLDATVNRYEVVSHIKPFGPDPLDSMSHPAFVGDRIYLRSKDEVVAFSLSASE